MQQLPGLNSLFLRSPNQGSERTYQEPSVQPIMNLDVLSQAAMNTFREAQASSMTPPILQRAQSGILDGNPAVQHAYPQLQSFPSQVGNRGFIFINNQFNGPIQLMNPTQMNPPQAAIPAAAKVPHTVLRRTFVLETPLPAAAKNPAPITQNPLPQEERKLVVYTDDRNGDLKPYNTEFEAYKETRCKNNS